MGIVTILVSYIHLHLIAQWYCFLLGWWNISSPHSSWSSNETKFKERSLCWVPWQSICPTEHSKYVWLLSGNFISQSTYSSNSLASYIDLLFFVSLSQVTIPFGKHDGCPISVSFLAFHGADKFLLDTVLDTYSSLQEQVILVSHSSPVPDTNGHMDASELLKEKVCSLLAYL